MRVLLIKQLVDLLSILSGRLTNKKFLIMLGIISLPLGDRNWLKKLNTDCAVVQDGRSLKCLGILSERVSVRNGGW